MKFGSKEHMDYLEKYVHEPLREKIDTIKEDIKINKVVGNWRDYRRFWVDKYYTIEESDASEVLRVKFYRAKEIYSKVMDKLDYKECDDCIYAFIDGYYQPLS